MMLFIRLCLDRPGMAATRAELRSQHRAYFMPNLEEGAVVSLRQAGPLRTDDPDGSMIGSFMVLEAPTIDDVRRFHEGDPFTLAGLFSQVHIHGWDRHIG